MSAPLLDGISVDANGGAAAPRRELPRISRDQLMLVFSVLGIAVAALVVAYQLFGGPPSAATLSRTRDMMCSETGTAFERYNVPDGATFPLANPKTGRNTLFPAEKCYWTKDGKAKTTPTLVLLNEFTGKTGTTICPDCGRKVTAHNALPSTDLRLEAAVREGKIKPEAPTPPK